MATTPADDQGVAPPGSGVATIQDRIAAFEMLDGMPDTTTQAQKCMRLSLCGFTRQEIATILQTTPQTVSQNLYTERNKGKPKPQRSALENAEN